MPHDIRTEPRTTIATRAWWIGVTLLTLALLVHSLVPRYRWQRVGESATSWTREDRWTGSLAFYQLRRSDGRAEFVRVVEDTKEE